MTYEKLFAWSAQSFSVVLPCSTSEYAITWSILSPAVRPPRLARGTAGNRASPAGSDDQLPGGRPCVPPTASVVPLRVTDPIVTFGGVGSGSRFPFAANRLGPVRSRRTALIGLPMYSDCPVLGSTITLDRSPFSL